MKKKNLLGILTLIGTMTLGLVGCGEKENPSSNSSPTTSTTKVPSTTTTRKPTVPSTTTTVPSTTTTSKPTVPSTTTTVPSTTTTSKPTVPSTTTTVPSTTTTSKPTVPSTTTTVPSTSTPIIETYTVVFEGNGGIFGTSSKLTVTVDSGELVSMPTAPVKRGSTFAAWYIDANYSAKFDFNTPITSNITLYAKFAETYNITFDTDGGEAINTIKYTDLDTVTLPIPSKDGFVFSHWVDANNNEFDQVIKDTFGNINLKAVYVSPTTQQRNYNTQANNFEAGSISGKDNVFGIGGEVRGRIVTWTNPNNPTETKTWNKSFKNPTISFTAPGDGVLSFYITNGSGDASTQKVKITAGNSAEEIEFAGNTSYGEYSGGNPVVKITMNIEEGVNYSITRVSGTIDIYEVNLDCSVVDTEVIGLSIISTGNQDYIEGEELDLSKLQIASDHGKYITMLDPKDYYVDYSEVDNTKTDIYTITVKYGQYEQTFDVNVFAVEELELGFDATYTSKNSNNGTYINGKVKTIYELNEELNTDYLTVLANTVLKSIDKQFIIKDNISYSTFDSSTAGEKTITITYTTNGETFTVDYKVYVVDSTPYQDSNNNYVVTVDQAYTGVIGAQNGNNGNMFTTIGQALEFLSRNNVTASSSKIINIGAGYYNEKLEINIPNLTMIGAGTCKATESTNENYVKTDYDSATIIEWDSLYGIADASGFSQVTDSTATVAVREEAINCTIKNITLSNYWNCEEVFQDNMEYLEEQGIAVGGTVNDHRALALIVQADKFTMDSCALLGYQDTVEFMTGRQFIYNTHISGNTDYIFGTNSTTYFYKCKIHVAYKEGGSGYITAFKGCNKGAADYVDYGLIFDDCSFTADSKVSTGSFALGRPWGAYSTVMIMNSDLGAHIAKSAGGRYVAMSGVNPTDDNVRYYEYANQGTGAITASQSGVTVLESTVAANYNNISIIYGTTNGAKTYTEAWVPSLYTEINS